MDTVLVAHIFKCGQLLYTVVAANRGALVTNLASHGLREGGNKAIFFSPTDSTKGAKVESIEVIE